MKEHEEADEEIRDSQREQEEVGGTVELPGECQKCVIMHSITKVQNIIQRHHSSCYKFIKGLLVVRDGDDDQYVENHSERRDEGQQNVCEQGDRVRAGGYPAGGVREVWKAEFSFLKGLHHPEKGDEKTLSSASLLTETQSCNCFIPFLPIDPSSFLLSGGNFLSGRGRISPF